MAEKEELAAVCPYSNHCIGMYEFTGCPGAYTNSVLQLETTLKPHPIPTYEQPHLSTATNEQPLPSTSTGSPGPSQDGLSRFKFATEQELSELAKGLAPYNTDECTKWELKNFGVWVTARNTAHPDDLIPEDILMSSDPDVLNRRLSQFVVETHKSNGQSYPPATLHQLYSVARQLHGTLDSYFNKLHSQGVGRRVKHAEIISTEEEDQLWESGVLNTTTPKGLQNPVFHAVGKIFCLRGGQEQRALKLSQFQCRDDSYVYCENV